MSVGTAFYHINSTLLLQHPPVVRTAARQSFRSSFQKSVPPEGLPQFFPFNRKDRFALSFAV